MLACVDVFSLRSCGKSGWVVEGGPRGAQKQDARASVPEFIHNTAILGHHRNVEISGRRLKPLQHCFGGLSLIHI